MNRTSHGIRYETETLTFATAEDRLKALDVLIAMMQKSGVVYTREQLSVLSDKYLLMILEPEDDEEEVMLKSLVVLMLDPSYKVALTAVQNAQKSGDVFASADERSLVYSMISKYFTMLNKSVILPLERWTDALLIRTFRSLSLPKTIEFPAQT